MRMGRAFLGAAVLAAAMAGPVQAKMAEVPYDSWTGFYVGGGFGFHWLDGDVDYNKTKSFEVRKECRSYTYSPDDNFWLKDYKECVPETKYERSHSFDTSADLDGDPSLFGTLIGGIDWQSKSNPRVVFGAFVDVDFGNANADFTLEKTIAWRDCECTYTIGDGDLELDHLLTVGGRIGVLSEDRKTLTYVLAGYSHAEMDGSLNLYHRGEVTTHALPSSFDGGTFGAGVETKLSDKLSLRLEGRATFLKSESATFSQDSIDPYPKDYVYYQGDTDHAYLNKCGDTITCTQKVIVKERHKEKTIDIDPDVFSFRAVLTYKFGRRHAMPAPLK